MNDLATAPPFVAGHFPAMPSATYHAIEAMSSSGAKRMRQSAAHYRVMRTTASEPTPQMEFGTVVHAGVLEPDTIDDVVAIAPAVNKRTKDGKAEFEAFAAAHAGKIIMSGGEWERAARCIDAVRQHPAAARLLAGAAIEESLFWVDGQYGVPCKARIDIRSRGGIVDLKTCQDASPDAFARTVATYAYHAQQAHYGSACEHLLDASPSFHGIIAVETEPPHAVAVYALDGAAIRAGNVLMSVALERYKAALASDEWPGYPDTIETLRLPKWALRFDI